MMKYKFKDTVRIILENSTATPIKGHWGIGYACCYCEYQSASPAELQQHTLNTHTVDDILFKSLKSHVDLIIKLDITGLKCKICDEKFAELDKFIVHLNVHGKKVHIDIKNYIIPFKFETEYLKCALCEHQCGTFKLLTEHMSLHYRNYECDLCSRGFISKRALKSHLMRHQTGIFKCTQCGKIFDSKIRMKEHERVVHVLLMKTRKCGYCEERFIDVVQKTTHEVKTHGAPVPVFECKACERKFDSSRSLKEHTNRTHLMLRPHTCSFCSMGFYYKAGLKRHLVKHTGVKEFECHVCNKMYSSKKSLGIHLRIHSDDRRFNCEKCGKAFVQQSSLSYHLRTNHRH